MDEDGERDEGEHYKYLELPQWILQGAGERPIEFVTEVQRPATGCRVKYGGTSQVQVLLQSTSGGLVREGSHIEDLVRNIFMEKT